MIIGFDVGGTNARGILWDATSGAIIDRTSRSSDGAGPILLAKLVEMVDELRVRNPVVVESIGLGIAGLAHQSGTVRYSPNLPELVEYSIGPQLERAAGAPVAVVNDATAGAWAEAKLGAGRGAKNLAYVALGTGIGTGFVVNGTLLLGANGFAGESGHMVVNVDGPTHHTGHRGPWEYFASGNALGRMGREAAAAGEFDLGIEIAGTIAKITGYHVAEGERRDDPQAAALFATFCGEVALGIANLVLILDPERVIIGGGLAEIGEPLRSGIDASLRHTLLGQPQRPTIEVVLAELGADANMIGAALTSLDFPLDPPK
jgi:glucokinase